MKARQSVFMAVMFAALLGGVWYFELREGAAPAKPKAEAGKAEEPEESAVFDDVDWDKVARIELTSPAQLGTIVLARDVAGADKSWRLLAPLATEADSSAVDTLVGTLKNLKAETVTSDPSKDLAPFGLRAPATQVKLTFDLGAKAKTERTLLAGDKAPVGYKAYFKRGDRPEILLTGAYSKTALEKKVFDLRNKSIVTAEKADVTGLELSSPAGDVKLVQREGVWTLAAPFQARAMGGEVDKLVSSLTSLRAVDVASEDGGDLASFGLDQPTTRATLITGDGEKATRHDLLFGRIDEGQKRIFVRDAGRAPVFVVSSYSVDGLKKSAGDLRDKKVLAFEKDAVRRVELRGAAGDIRIARTGDTKGDAPKDAKAEAGRWVIEAPAPGEADQANVNQMLITLAGLEAKAFLDGDQRPLPIDSGLEEPELEVRLVGESDGELGTLDVGSAVPGSGAPATEGAPATPPDRYVKAVGFDTVYVVAGRFLDDMPKRVDDLTKKKAEESASAAPPAEARPVPAAPAAPP